GGAIVITTKRGRYQDPDTPLSNIAVINPLGYQAPAEFYSPRYETEQSRSIGPPDLRTTIHWEPDVNISPEGVAAFGFYTADTPASYRVLIEGVTSDGLIILKQGRITMK
ncbi:MAG TPA: TonB-dependent receptor, partial [Bacteroidales bacterium]|nr:TonB-dependent receptor [Bacteroidales bacterium]HRW28304.1 TonB-dependent receptor [Bacteroidales bacterium]